MTTIRGIRHIVGKELYATTCILFRAAITPRKRSSLLSKVNNILKKVLGRFRRVAILYSTPLLLWDNNSLGEALSPKAVLDQRTEQIRRLRLEFDHK